MPENFASMADGICWHMLACAFGMLAWGGEVLLSYHCTNGANPDGWAVWGVVVSTRWWLLVDHCVLRNWDPILVRAVKGLISRAGMVSICPLLWQREVKLQQTKPYTNGTIFGEHLAAVVRRNIPQLIIGYWTNTVFWDRVLWSEFDHRACEAINPTKERGPKTLYEFNNRIITYRYKIINLVK